MSAAPRKYKPTFTESKPRPVHQRLTPLAWFCIFLVILALIGAVIVTVRKLSESLGGNQSLDQRLGIPATSVAVHAKTDAPADNVSVPAAGVSAPAQVEQPASRTAADTAALGAVDKAVSTAIPTPVEQAAAPTALAMPSNSAPWATEMAQQTDGTWMAPKEVVAQASENIKAYYMAARNRSLEEYLQQRDQILTTYYINNGLQLMHAYEAKRAQYGMNKSGEVSVEVKSFAQDGLTAQVDVTTKNWVNDVYDIKTKQLTKSDFKQQDSVLSLAIRFDPTGNRWKIENVLGVVRLH